MTTAEGYRCAHIYKFSQTKRRIYIFLQWKCRICAFLQQRCRIYTFLHSESLPSLLESPVTLKIWLSVLLNWSFASLHLINWVPISRLYELQITYMWRLYKCLLNRFLHKRLRVLLCVGWASKNQSMQVQKVENQFLVFSSVCFSFPFSIECNGPT